jgi:hypothetical protein
MLESLIRGHSGGFVRRRSGACALALAIATFAPGMLARAANGEAGLSAGVAAFNGGNYEQAVAVLTAANDKKPSTKALIYIGNAQLKLGDLTAALNAFQRAHDLEHNAKKRDRISALIKVIGARNFGSVKVTSDPPGADIYITASSAAAGKTPQVVMLMVGRQSIRVALDGYEPGSIDADVQQGEEIAVELKLQPKPCKLLVAVNPTAARAAIDGAAPAPLSSDGTIAPGDHVVALSADGYRAKTVRLRCEAGKEVELRAELAPAPGRLKLAVTSGATVRIDGKPVAITPADVAAGIGLEPGHHEVEVSSPGRPLWKSAVEVRSGAEVALATPEAQKPGRLKIQHVKGAVVLVDDKPVQVRRAAATDDIGIAPGRHEVVVQSPNQPPYKTVVEVGAGDDVPVSASGEAATLVAAGPRRSGFPRFALYAGFLGSGNVVLRDWNLGHNAFVAQNGVDGAHPQSSGEAGIRAGVQVISRLAVEGELRWVGLPTSLGFASGLSYDVNLLANILARSWTPIVEAGGGAVSVVSGALGGGTAPFGHVGIGLRGRVEQRVAVRVEIRDVFTQGFDKGGGNNLELIAGLELLAFQR